LIVTTRSSDTTMAGEVAPTKREYMEDTYRFKSVATLLKIKDSQDPKKGKKTVILDTTIFHPQGGGQPSDTGTIFTAKAKFAVKDVRDAGGIVEHYGDFEEGESFNVEEKVQLEINEKDRRLFARLHSAGHALDVAVSALKLKLVPGKGFHFPTSPYVEYEGTIEAAQRAKVVEQLQQELNKVIAQDLPVKVQWTEYNKIKDLIGVLPSYLEKDKPSRIVIMGSEGCPCGGTHVKNLSELGKVSIKGVKARKNTVRISYKVE